ncbi:MAG: hypothetical protein EOP06_17630 [Proteobacteria bacterium]|nr:MAG: hypothetical protein EOP06_17630 [Pseudomonadota bacterium]
MDPILTPRDGGMLYTETDLTRLFPEPLNAITSLFFLVLAAYWLWKLRGKYRQHAYLTFSVVLLSIGAIGGSIYHGLRIWRVFIMMDWLPIMLLCVFTGIYFIVRLTRWYWAALVVIVYGIFQYLARQQMRVGGNIQLFINVNYSILGLLVLGPVLAYLLKTNFAHGKWVGFALVAFLLALLFRVVDGYEWFAFGTHFLWHTFGAIAGFCMLEFLYRINHDVSSPRP